LKQVQTAKQIIDSESEEDSTSSLLEDSSNREFEIVLVFQNGRQDRKWNKPHKSDSRESTLFAYLDTWEFYEGMEDQDYTPSEYEAFEGIIQATCFVLVEKHFHVKRLDEEDLPQDPSARRKCGKYTFVTVGMTERQFREWAHQSRYLLPLEPQILQRWLAGFKNRLATSIADMQKGRFITWDCFQDLYAPYNNYLPHWIYQTRRNVWKKDPTLAGETLFSTSDRIKMIIEKLESNPNPHTNDLGGCGMDLDSLKYSKGHPLHEYFALHDRYDIRMIRGPFRFKRNGRIKLPLQQLRYYYGEYIGFYYGFMEFSVNHMILPAIVGIVLFVQQMITGVVNNGFSAAYGIFMIFWAISFPTLWQQQELILSNFWGQTSVSKKEGARPEFEGAMVYSPVNGSMIPYETPARVRQRKCRTQSVLSLCLVALGINIMLLIILRNIVEDSMNVDKADVYMGFITAIVILLTNGIYYYVAIWANDNENHLTDTEYENAKIWKSFAFRFLNAYNALFYITFFKSSDIGCRESSDDEQEGCFKELRITLAVIFGTLLFWQNITELVPLWIYIVDFTRNRPNEIYDQWRLSSYESTWGDLDELIIQFGYICIFVVAFPLAPAVGLISIVLEIVVDQYKMSNLVRRPIPQGGQDLGDWVELLYIIAAVSVTVNIAIICFVTDDLNNMLGVDPDTVSRSDELVMFIFCEHIIIIVFLMLFAYFTQRMEKLGKKNEREHYIQTVLHTHSQSIQHHWETWESWTEKEVRDWLYAMGGQEKAHVAQRFLENRIRGQGLKYLSEDDLRTKLEIREHGDRIWAWELLVDLRQPAYGDPECMEYLMKARDAGIRMRKLDGKVRDGTLTKDDFAEDWKLKTDVQEEDIQSNLRKSGGHEGVLRFDVYSFGDFLANSEDEHNLDESVLKRLWDELTKDEDTLDASEMRDVLFPYVQLYLEHFKITYNESFDEVVKEMIQYLQKVWNRKKGAMVRMKFRDVAWIGRELIDRGLEEIQDLADSDQWDITEHVEKEVDKEDSDSETQEDSAPLIGRAGAKERNV